ncbi:hypothetical protein [Clostridium sp. CCUG 7971]|uniref:hypothetical protein n=1 Tax=Clostridium sp. CCUG 7971 TaxID=2811414 RepID=UPI001ABAE733|nr:hypothetical protein [Clostridium sp. CCUG 7971]MBO3445542.1 hypothetical protein [Clostridium sp. CCUG 7971]
MKKHLMDKDISKIKKLKLSTKYDNLDLESTNLLNEYEYYIKLIKKKKKYIKSNKSKYIILDIKEDKNKFLVGILNIIDFNSKDIGIQMDIILLTGSLNKAHMDCTCYKINDYSMLYINNFKSRISNRGYGSILLSNLDFNIKEINNVLNKYSLKEIKLVEGLVVADKNIIEENDLINLYKKYGFEVDKYNRMHKNIK